VRFTFGVGFQTASTTEKPEVVSKRQKWPHLLWQKWTFSFGNATEEYRKCFELSSTDEWKMTSPDPAQIDRLRTRRVRLREEFSGETLATRRTRRHNRLRDQGPPHELQQRRRPLSVATDNQINQFTPPDITQLDGRVASRLVVA